METGSRQFGMCMHIASEQGGFASHGTMLEIQVSQFTFGLEVITSHIPYLMVFVSCVFLFS